ncbi:MAG: TolC family protein [Bacteroidia bacterium]|nr:TolC family protein [Bacteroidia bacterium]
MRWGWLIAWGIGLAQDTLYLSLQEAEQRFLEKNLLLLAHKLQIEAEKALVWQARLWPNPQLTIEQLDPFTSAEAGFPPLLNNPRINQIASTFSQTILTARKRLKGIALAEASVQVQEAAFAELLRQLRYELRKTLYGLQRDQVLIELTTRQAELLNQLSQRYRRLSESALVPLPEYLRIENLYMQALADLREIRQRWEAQQNTLRQLLRVPGEAPILWIDTTGFYRASFPLIPPLEALLSRVGQRGDVKLAAAEMRLQEASLSVERALAYPDIDIVVNFDRTGGYRFNQWGVGWAMPLPLFNRNQGRIAAARYARQASELRYQQAYLTAQSEVIQAWRNALFIRSQWEQTSLNLLERYQRAEAAYRENLMAGRIGFLTYIDFFESYRTLTTNITELFYLSHQVQNDIQYATGDFE